MRVSKEPSCLQDRSTLRHHTQTMAVSRLLLPFFLLIAITSGAYDDVGQPPISRRSFPEGFIFGTSSASYQVKVLRHSYIAMPCFLI